MAARGDVADFFALILCWHFKLARKDIVWEAALLDSCMLLLILAWQNLQAYVEVRNCKCGVFWVGVFF